MTTTERLIDSSKNRFARELLRSAELDEAPDNTVAKVAFALGLGSTAVVTTVTSSAAAATGIATGVGSTTAVAAPTASAVTAVGMLKVMAIVSLTCGTLSYGGVKLALKVTDRPAAATTVVAARRAIAKPSQNLPAPRAVASFAPEAPVNVPAPPAADDSDWVAAAPGQEPQQPELAEASSPRETNPTNVGRQFNNSNVAQLGASSANAGSTHAASANVAAESPTSPMPPPRATMPATASFPTDDARGAPKGRTAANLEREVAQLDHARAALVAGQPAIALREIDAYRVQNPRGMLVAESVVLRVRALLDMGFRSIAEREAEPLLRSAPQSRHAERLRQILGITSSTP